MWICTSALLRKNILLPYATCGTSATPYHERFGSPGSNGGGTACSFNSFSSAGVAFAFASSKPGAGRSPSSALCSSVVASGRAPVTSSSPPLRAGASPSGRCRFHSSPSVRPSTGSTVLRASCSGSGLFVWTMPQEVQGTCRAAHFYLAPSAAMSSLLRRSARALLKDTTAHSAAGSQPSTVSCKIRHRMPESTLPLRKKDSHGRRMASKVMAPLLGSGIRK